MLIILPIALPENVDTDENVNFEENPFEEVEFSTVVDHAINPQQVVGVMPLSEDYCQMLLTTGEVLPVNLSFTETVERLQNVYAQKLFTFKGHKN